MGGQCTTSSFTSTDLCSRHKGMLNHLENAIGVLKKHEKGIFSGAREEGKIKEREHKQGLKPSILRSYWDQKDILGDGTAA